jgi:hypothetical protein
LLNSLAAAVLGAALSGALFLRGSALNSSDLQIMSAILAPSTLVLVVNLL